MGNNSHWPQRSWTGIQAPQCISLMHSAGIIYGVINDPGTITIQGETRVIRTVTPVGIVASSCLPFKLYCVYGYYTGPDSLALELALDNIDPYGTLPYHRNTQPSRIFLGAIWVNGTGSFASRIRSFYEPAQAAYSSDVYISGANIPVPYIGPPYNSYSYLTNDTVRTLMTERTEIILPNEQVYLSAHIAVSPQQNTVAVSVGTHENYMAGVTITTVNLTNTATISGFSHSVLVGDYVWITEIESTQAIKDKAQQVTAVTPTSISFVDANITLDETTVCCVLLETNNYNLASRVAQGDSGVNLKHIPVQLEGAYFTPLVTELRNFCLSAQKFSNIGNAYINYLDQAYLTSSLRITRDPNKSKLFI